MWNSRGTEGCRDSSESAGELVLLPGTRNRGGRRDAVRGSAVCAECSVHAWLSLSPALPCWLRTQRNLSRSKAFGKASEANRSA